MTHYALDVLTALSFLVILMVPWSVFLERPVPGRKSNPLWLPFAAALVIWAYLTSIGQARLL